MSLIIYILFVHYLTYIYIHLFLIINTNVFADQKKISNESSDEASNGVKGINMFLDNKCVM